MRYILFVCILCITQECRTEAMYLGLGKVSHFGGPNDIWQEREQPCYVYPNILVGHLNPNTIYCAVRFPTRIHRELIKRADLSVTVIKTGLVYVIKDCIVDFGPSNSKGRIIDFSPALLKLLGIITDDEVFAVLFVPLNIFEPIKPELYLITGWQRKSIRAAEHGLPRK